MTQRLNIRTTIVKKIVRAIEVKFVVIFVYAIVYRERSEICRGLFDIMPEFARRRTRAKLFNQRFLTKVRRGKFVSTAFWVVRFLAF